MMPKFLNFDTEDEQDFIKNLLKENVVEITFAKTDGTIRVLKATLKKENLPVIAENKNTTSVPKKKSTEALAVYDTEKQGWRSFRWDSVVSIKFDLGNENA